MVSRSATVLGRIQRLGKGQRGALHGKTWSPLAEVQDQTCRAHRDGGREEEGMYRRFEEHSVEYLKSVVFIKIIDT